MLLTDEQNKEIWRISILLMQADGKEELTYGEFLLYKELVDVDAIVEAMPKRDDTVDAEVKFYSTKISHMRIKWPFLKELSYKECFLHELFSLCNTYGNWTRETLDDPELLAHAKKLVGEEDEE